MKNLNLKELFGSTVLAFNHDGRTTVERRSNDGHIRRHLPVGLTKLLSLFILLTLGVGQMWAAGQNNQNWKGNVFFRAPENWDLSTNSHVQIAITRTSSVSTSSYTVLSGDMTRVGTTRLYYIWLSIDHSSWNQNEYIAFIANSSTKTADAEKKINGYTCYTTPYDYGVGNADCPYLFNPTSESNGASVSGTCYTAGSSYGDRWYPLLDKAQTVNLYTNGSSSKTGGSVTIAGTYMSAANTTTATGSATSSTTSVNYTTLIGSSVSLTATPATGYQFDGWYTAGTSGSLVSSSNPYSYTCTGTKTVYARFSEKTYSLTFSHNGHGSISVGGAAVSSGSTAKVNYFTTKTLVATANTGYHFAGWTKSGSNTSAVTIGDESADGTSTTIKAINTGATITAVFEADASNYTLTFGAGSNGSVSAKNTSTEAALTSGSEYASGTGVSVTATPAAHYHLEGWYSDAGLTTPVGGAGTTNPYSFSLTSNTAVYAKFALNQCAITLDRNGGTAGDESVTATYGSTLSSFTAHTRSGYTLNGYFTATSGGTKIINADGTLVASTSYANSSKQWDSDASALELHAQWTENKRNVTISAGTGGSVNVTSGSVGVATSVTVTATALPGYKFSSWTATNCSVTSSTSASTTLKGDGNTGSGTLVANFIRTYAFIEGRFQIKNAARTASTYTGTSNNGYWATDSRNIEFEYDGTNHRFFLHTYMKPAELAAKLSNNTQYFTIQTSTSKSSLTGGSLYTPASTSPDSNQKLSASGSANKKATSTTANRNDSFWFTSSDNSGYAILYFDEAGVWYELEHTLEYGGNGGTGSAPASKTYYNHGVNATAASNTYSKAGYTFNGWKTGTNSGTSYAAGASVPMNSNITLYAQWQINNHAVTYTAPSHGSYTIKVGTADAVSANTTSDYGKQITLAANPAPGYHFVSWSVYKTGEPATTVTVTNNQFTMPDYPVTVSATFAANTYSVTFNANGGTGDAMNPQAFTYDAAQALSANTYTRTGYDFDGWATAAEGAKAYDDGENVNNLTATNGGSFPLYAHWAAKRYTVTLDIDDANHGTIDGKATSASVTFDATPTAIAADQLPTAAQGYAFMGFFSAPNGKGSQFINADGTWVTTVTDTISDGKWVSPAIATLYAYYKKAEITALTITPSTAGLGATVTVTPTIDPMPTGNYNLCWKLLRNNDNEITGTTFTLTDDDKDDPHAVQFTAPGSSGTYKVQCILSTGSTACAGTLLGSRVQTFTVAGEHTVTIRYQDASDRTLAASTEVTGRPLTWSEAIAAPPITGYTFDHWEAGDGIILSTNGTSELGSNTTTTDPVYVEATYAGNLTAVYNKKNVLYFNNTLGWEHVYVYFYSNGNYWNSNKNNSGNSAEYVYGSGANTTTTNYSGVYTGNYGEMRRIAGTNIYYFDWQAEGWSQTNYVTFTKDDQHDYEWFDNTEVVRLADAAHYYDKPGTMMMYVPLPAVYENRNKNGEKITKYYTEGYWMNYPENTGYTLKIYNGTGGSASELQSIPFEFTGDYTMPMSVTAELEAGRTYGYKIYRNDGSWFGNGGTMRNGASGDEGQAVWEFTTGSSSNCGLTTSAAGEYTFTLTYAPKSGTYYYLVGVHYPVAVGSYRLVYTDEATTLWSGHTKPANWYHPSRAIEKKDGAKDIISFYVSKETGANANIKVQYASAINASTGAITWADGTDATHTSVTLDLNSITSSGVYNFHLTQADGSISVEKIEAYTGNYYIRTDCAGTTKWDNYRAADHQMTYSEFSKDRATNTFGELYTHYYMHWCPRSTNIKFVIANDYSMCITDTLENDLVDWGNMSSPGWLNNDGANPDYRDKYSANIRFMYDERTNKISRAYMSSSTNTDRKFLVLKSNTEFKNSDGTALSGSGESKTAGNYEAIFKDNEDWIYEREIKLTPGQKFKLYASYAQATVQEDGSQHFRGNYADDDWENAENYVELVGGTGSACNARIVYDFKTNRLMSAYVPDNDNPIEGNPDINADIMIVRNHQDAGQQITFTTGSSLNAVKTVYGVMRFNRWILNNRQHPEDMIHDHSIDDSEMNKYHPLITDPGSQRSSSERGLYWISFPFNVNLSEVFGFGTYGTHWIVMKYNGEERAKQGFWADSEGFWEYIWDRKDVVLEKGKGYVLALDLDRMKANDRTFWNNEIQQVELFFPSTATVGTIQQTDVDVDVPAWECKIGPRFEGGDDRTKKDSHWNIIGVPSYANYNSELTDGSATITWNANPETQDLPFLYEWNANDNTYTVQSGTSYPFKAMHAYYVQYHGTLHWSLASATPPSIVARRAYEKPQNEEFRLELQQNEKMVDQTFVKLSNDENASADFRFEEDLCKELNSRKANIYTYIADVQAAGNTLPMIEQTTVVPMGVQIAADGEYTFAMPEGTNGTGVTLIDNETGTRTSLALTDYTVTLAKGTYDNRFVLEFSPVAQTPTGIEDAETVNRKSSNRKLLIDGILYIVKDGQVFDARGTKVK